MITPNQFSKISGYSAEAIRRMCRNGKIKAKKRLGGDWIIPPEEINRLAEQDPIIKQNVQQLSLNPYLD